MLVSVQGLYSVPALFANHIITMNTLELLGRLKRRQLMSQEQAQSWIKYLVTRIYTISTFWSLESVT